MPQFLQDFVDRQLNDYSGVVPFHNFYNGKLHLNCCFGEIFYYPKTENDLVLFRNNWVNKFHKIILDGGDRRRFSALYLEIMLKERVSYRAGVRTRMELIKCFLKFYK